MKPVFSTSYLRATRFAKSDALRLADLLVLNQHSTVAEVIQTDSDRWVIKTQGRGYFISALKLNNHTRSLIDEGPEYLKRAIKSAREVVDEMDLGWSIDDQGLIDHLMVEDTLKDVDWTTSLAEVIEILTDLLIDEADQTGQRSV